MALNIKINFDSAYDFADISPGYNLSSFETVLEDGKNVNLKVKISNNPHALIPNVFNLAFGPLNKQGKLDDKAELSHRDYSKVFSTILFSAYAWLKKKPDDYIGIDGSDNIRAYLYYRAIKNNFVYLDKHFIMYGVKYYVRISRFGKTQYANPFDFEDIVPYPYRIDKDHTISQDAMFNYFIFKLREIKK